MTRYLLAIATLSLLVTAAIAMFNYRVDPLLLYHSKNAGSEQLSRIDQFQNMRLYKPLHINQLVPDTIIIGSSRSGTLRPANIGSANRDAYNFSLPGITIYELSRAVKHAHANKPLARLMIGLDYGSLISPLPVYRQGFQPARMAEDSRDFYSPGFIWQKFVDLQATLFSVDILGDSISALNSTGDGPRSYFADGSWEANSNRLTGRGGYVYVARNELTISRNSAFAAGENLAILRDLLDFLHGNNIDTRIYFTPMHVFFVDLWLHMAPEQLWRSTYRSLLDMNAQVAAQHRQPAFPVWGFGNRKRSSAEPIYRARDINKAWFNDGVHYRPKMARKIMAAVWGEARGFGQQLTPESIGDYLDDIYSLRREFMAANKPLVDELHQKIGLKP